MNGSTKRTRGWLVTGAVVGMAALASCSSTTSTGSPTTTSAAAPGATAAGPTATTMAGTGSTASGKGSGEVLALTYNVAGLPQGLSGSNPQEYMPLIGPLLNDYELVLTQEDFQTPEPNPLAPVRFFHEILVEKTNHPYKPAAATAPLLTNPARPTAAAADGLNMFSRFPVGEVTRVAWTKCFGGADTKDGGAADCLAMKGFAHAAVTFADGVVVDVYDLHGEAGSTPADLDASASDYVELAAFINERSKGHAVLLGGDTNLNTGTTPGDKTIWDTFLTATGLQDACRVVDCGDDAEDIDKWAFRSNDTITLEPLTRTVELEKFKAPGSPELNDGQLSDHEAVAARWRWTRR